MRAVQIQAFGEPDVLQAVDLPDPTAADGQVLIDVAAAEVLFLDVQLRKGWGGDHFPITPPFVLGMGVAGAVAEVGAGVDRAWVGRRVIAALGEAGTYDGGGYAERAVAPVGGVHVLPDGLDPVLATAAISDGVMGVSRLEYAGLTAGDTVVVTAAAGSIAGWLIPEAVRTGVRVIALARGSKGAVAQDHGAEVLIDYGVDGWRDELDVALAGVVPAAIFDGTGGDVGREVWERAGSGTRFFAYGSAGDFVDTSDADRRGVRVWDLSAPLTPDDRRRWTATALEWLAEGRVEPVIGQRVPLEQAAEAHAAIEARTVTGKTVLVTG